MIALLTIGSWKRKITSVSERQNQQRDLEGLTFVHNEEAELLEQHLGISFNPRPLKVEVGSLSRLSPRMRRLGFGLHLGRLQKAGVYLDEHKLILTSKGFGVPRKLRQFYPLHENMHAYVHQQNPAYGIYQAEFPGVETEEGLSRYMEELDSVEIARELSVYVNEGIAQWGAAETLARMGISLEPNKNPHDSVFKMNQYILKRGRTRKQRSKYYQGFIFVAFTMDDLEEFGVQTADALNLIIQDPPRTFEEFIHSEDYIKRLLAAK